MEDPVQYVRQTLPELLRIVQSTDVRELDVSDGEMRIHLSRMPLAVELKGEVEFTPVELEPALPGIDEITSPLVGTFYRASQPGAPPLVEEGSAVEVDTVVGIVEVLNVLTEVEAGCAGVVTRVLATDGHAVEYGQPLFEVTPRG